MSNYFKYYIITEGKKSVPNIYFVTNNDRQYNWALNYMQ